MAGGVQEFLIFLTPREGESHEAIFTIARGGLGEVRTAVTLEEGKSVGGGGKGRGRGESR